MLTNDERFMLNGNDPRRRAPAAGLPGRILAAVLGAVALVVALMFSLLIFVAVASVALLAGGYLWWKTRALRRQLRERPPGGRIIDGEVVRETDLRETTRY